MAGILFLLGIAMASALVVQRVRLPYTIVLVFVGLVLGSAGVHPGFDLDRDLILHVFLPLLLFEAALRVDLGVLREAWLPIVVLAVPGVVLSKNDRWRWAAPAHRYRPWLGGAVRGVDLCHRSGSCAGGVQAAGDTRKACHGRGRRKRAERRHGAGAVHIASTRGERRVR